MTFDEIFDEAGIDRSRNGSYSFHDLREVVSAMNRRFQPLLDAAKEVLGNALDGESFGPDESCIDPNAGIDFPRDEDGDLWYHDFWELKQAIAKAEGGAE